MELEPGNLGIPLQRRDRLPLVLVVACAAVAACIWWVDATFAHAFIAACVLVLPPMAVALWSRRLPGGVGVALLFVYLGLCKSVLLPMLLRWLHDQGLG